MTKDTQINPGDIVTVTEVVGYQPVSISPSFNDIVTLTTQTEYDVIREIGDFVGIREVGRYYGTEKIVHRLFLQLKVRVENRPRFILKENETSFEIKEFALKGFGRDEVSYTPISDISKSAPIELLEEAIRLIKQENEKESDQ